MKQTFTAVMVGAGVVLATTDVAQGAGLAYVGVDTFNSAAATGTQLGNTLNFVGWAGLAHSSLEVAQHAYQISQWDNGTSSCEKIVNGISLTVALGDLGANIAGQICLSPAGGALVGLAGVVVTTAWDQMAEHLVEWCRSGDPYDDGPLISIAEKESWLGISVFHSPTAPPPDTPMTAAQAAFLHSRMPPPQLLRQEWAQRPTLLFPQVHIDKDAWRKQPIRFHIPGLVPPACKTSGVQSFCYGVHQARPHPSVMCLHGERQVQTTVQIAQ